MSVPLQESVPRIRRAIHRYGRSGDSPAISDPDLAQGAYEESKTRSKHRTVTDFLVRNRMHLGPGAVLIAWAFAPWYGSNPAWAAAPSILLVGFGIYQLNRVFDLVEDQINDPAAYARTATSRNTLRAAAVGALMAALVLSAVFMGILATALLAIMALLGVLYSVPFFGRELSKLHRLKQVPALKNLVPSVVWPVTTILYPAIFRTGVHVLPLVLAITSVACSVFTIEVAWDVRDSLGDRVAGIRTLATSFGPSRALVMPLAIGSVQALIIALLVYFDELATRWLFLATLLALLPAVAYLWKSSLASNRDRSHLLVLLNISALIPIGLVGRWGV